MKTTVDFKKDKNYHLVDFSPIDDNETDVNTSATCQDCFFSIFNKYNKTNELTCTNGNINVNVNGVCNEYTPVV